jgi:DNA replication protein DnaC
MIDAQRLSLMLNELRLPAIKQMWGDFAARADKEGWPAARLLAALAEHEIAERDRRRTERHLAEAKLPAGKTHLAAAIGLALVENGWRVLFARTSDLVQRLQVARRELALESALARLDKYHLLVLDDFAYISRDQAETSVLFELISARYERRSMLITANQPFGEWNSIFPGPAMTLAAVDRLVHHATIFEMNVESYRRRTAEARRPGPGRPANFTTTKVLEAVRDNQDAE